MNLIANVLLADESYIAFEGNQIGNDEMVI